MIGIYSESFINYLKENLGEPEAPPEAEESPF